MLGIQVFMDALTLHGADAIFGNPGTTENPLLDALIDYPDIHYYVALHEGVAVGAANYYAQASGRTAVANVHVAPGLGNAIGMMYGALKANSPLIVTAGQQDTRMRLREPLLSHDLVAMAAPVTKWSVEPQSADEVSTIMRRAFRIASEPPMGPVFVSMPINVMSEETEIAAEHSGELQLTPEPNEAALSKLTAMILASEKPAIVAGDDVARSGSNAWLVRLAEMTGAAVYHEGIHAQTTFPNRHPSYHGRIPFEGKGIRRLLSAHDFVLLTDGPFFEEVWFDPGSPFPEGLVVAQVGEAPVRIARQFPVDLGIAGHLPVILERLLSGLEAAMEDSYRLEATVRNQAMQTRQQDLDDQADASLRKQWEARPMTPARAIHEIASALPENTVIVDESITASLDVGRVLPVSDAGDYFGARGGGIGQGLAGVLGVKVANPDRPVVCFSGDGSAMYSIQAFWTAAHHELPILFVILCNREYRVLKHNLDIYRNRFTMPSNRPYPNMDLTNPVLGFAALASGMGVTGECIEDPDDLAAAVTRALESGQPRVLEVVVSGKQ